MARSATKTARPTTPPATPPAIAAVFDLCAGVAVEGVDWPIAVGIGAILVDVGDEDKLLVEEDAALAD